MEYRTLHNGVKIPCIGFGTWKINDSDAERVVPVALSLGYRHIDTAAYYQNEKGVGIGIKNSNIDRKDIFVTSKVWETDQGYEKTLKAFDLSLKKLGLDYLDLYLIHWPKENSLDTWKAMEKLYKEGFIRAIGVSNFHEKDLAPILEQGSIVPLVNQVEFHPFLIQKHLLDFCRLHKIQYEAWSPLKRGAFLDHPILKDIAKKHRKSTAQIVLRWDVEMGVVTIPKTSNPERMKENLNIFDFKLDETDMKQISSMEAL